MALPNGALPREPLRIGVAVRAQDGQIANFRIQTARNLADGRVRRETIGLRAGGKGVLMSNVVCRFRQSQ